jgi:hypothetical protein
MATWRRPKITQYMYQQSPEQSRGLLRHDAAPTVTLIYLPVQGPCR